MYYDALGRAQEGWYEGMGDAVPFINHLLGTILAAYKDFEDRFSIVPGTLFKLCQRSVEKASKGRIV